MITGDDDRIVPTKDSVRLAGELPNAELVVIPQCGHTPQEECPEPWLDAVTRFVSGSSKATGFLGGARLERQGSGLRWTRN